MKLITVEASFSADKIEAAIDAFNDQSQHVTSMQGCESYGLYRAGNSVAIVQKWQDMQSFETYRQSDIFAGLGATLKPLMSQPPVTTVASIDNT